MPSQSVSLCTRGLLAKLLEYYHTDSGYHGCGDGDGVFYYDPHRLYIMENLPDMIIKYLTAVSENKYVILAMLNVFMIIIGMLMDDVSGTLLCTPILLPIIMKIGVHPIHFAAILGVNLGLVMLHLPALRFCTWRDV